MAELPKFFVGDTVEILRSEIRFADYNPRTINEKEKKTLKKGIKKYGMVGGLIVNKRTNNTIVGGHQRISVMDEMQHYDADTLENDYLLRVNLIDIDEVAEKELVILLNNPNAQGQWDWDKLGAIIPQIDYKAAGLTNADLSMAGVDFLTRTTEQNFIADNLNEMMAQVDEQHRQEVQRRKEERDLLREQERLEQAAGAAEMPITNAANEADEEMSYEERKQAMKDLKQQVREQAIERAANASAYITLSFDDYDAKQQFLQIFNLPPNQMIVKGEDVLNALEYFNEE